MLQKYTAGEYKILIDKISKGEATQEEIDAVQALVKDTVVEIDTILKDNQ